MRVYERPDTYRVMAFGEKEPTIQGYFFGLQDIKDYMKRRGLGDTGAFRLERLWNGKWLFVENFAIV